MAPPPPSSKPKKSLEAEPLRDQKPREPEDSAETAGERHEAGRMEAKGESARARTNISLENLQERAEHHNYDTETPDQINRINLTQAPEAQRVGLDALRDVSIVMIASMMHRNPTLAGGKDINSFENISHFEPAFESIHPQHAENAAFHKLRELGQHTDSAVTQHMRGEWPNIVAAARTVDRNMQALRDADFTKKEPEKEKGFVSKSVELIKNHPVASFAIMAGAAWIGFKLFKFLRGDRSPAPGAAGETSHPPEKHGSTWKWLMGIGAGVLGLIGFGKLLGLDGVKDFFKKKLGWNVDASRLAQILMLVSQGKLKEAWEIAWQGVDEKAEQHAGIADTISKEMHVEVSGKTIFELKDENFNDFISSSAQWKDEASIKTGGFIDEHAGIAAGALKSLAMFDSKEKNIQQIAIRGFLKKHLSYAKANMPIREKTTVGEVLDILHNKLPKAEAAQAAAQTPAEAHKKSKGTLVPVAAGVAGVVAAAEIQSHAKKEKKHLEMISPDDRTSLRDDAREGLSDAVKKRRTITRENLLEQKIKSSGIAAMKKVIEAREEEFGELFTKDLKPQERKEAEDKFEAFLNQKDELAKLIQRHEQADDAYLAALRSDAPEELLAQRFAALLAIKEQLASRHEEMFKRDGLSPLPLFAQRYALLSSRKTAVVREQVRRTFSLPGKMRDAHAEGRNPVEFYEKELGEAERDLAAYASSKPDISALAAERMEKTLKVEALEKRLAFERKKVEFGLLSESERGARQGELHALEKEYLEAYQKHLGSSIEYAKHFLDEAGENLSEREKIAFIFDIKEANRDFSTALSEYREKILKEFGRGSEEVRVIDEMTQAYRKNIRSELSIMNKFKFESKGLRNAFVEWLHGEKESGLVKFARSGKGRIGVMGLLLLPGLYLERKEILHQNPDVEATELYKELGLDALQVLADVMPFTFGFSDWYTVKTGTELVTRKQVKGWNRYGHIVWGSLGALLDSASLIPAVDIAGAPANALVRAARAAGRASEGKKLIKAWPKIKAVAEHLGGWKKFAKHLAEYREAPRAIEKTRAVARMATVAAPRAAALVYIGGTAYNAYYTAGEDGNDKGEEISADVVKEIEKVAPEAPPES